MIAVFNWLFVFAVIAFAISMTCNTGFLVSYRNFKKSGYENASSMTNIGEDCVGKSEDKIKLYVACKIKEYTHGVVGTLIVGVLFFSCYLYIHTRPVTVETVEINSYNVLVDNMIPLENIVSKLSSNSKINLCYYDLDSRHTTDLLGLNESNTYSCDFTVKFDNVSSYKLVREQTYVNISGSKFFSGDSYTRYVLVLPLKQ